MTISSIVQNAKPYDNDRLDYGIGRFASGIVQGYFMGRDRHATAEPAISFLRFERAVELWLLAHPREDITILTDLPGALPKLYDAVLRVEMRA